MTWFYQLCYFDLFVVVSCFFFFKFSPEPMGRGAGGRVRMTRMLETGQTRLSTDRLSSSVIIQER